MEKKQQKALAIAGAGIAAAAALGVTGATLANAASETGTTPSAVAPSSPRTPSSSGATAAPGEGQGGGMRDSGGTLTADAASKAVAAAAAEVDGGTVHGVRALSDGTYRVDVSTSDGTRVHVLLDKAFAVTSVEEGGAGKGGGRGMPDAGGSADAPSGGTLPGGGSTGSTDPGDASGTSTSTTSPPT